MTFDLNCDLGEEEPISRTRHLMRLITSANVACGGHAGTAQSMETCARLAKACEVRLGAHPGLPGEFGRGEAKVSPRDLELLLLQQVGALEKIARACGSKLHHIKLHGALYHATDSERALARSYLRAVARWWPGVIVYARDGGLVSRWAATEQVVVWREAFADRNYEPDGALVPRRDPSALLTNARVVLERIRLMIEKRGVPARNGTWVKLTPKTICIHADTPQALAMARAIRTRFYN